MKPLNQRICLLYPPYAGVSSNPPLGIPSLVGYLKKHGYTPLVLDMDSFVERSSCVGRMHLSLHRFLALRSRSNQHENTWKSIVLHRAIDLIKALRATSYKRRMKSLNIDNIFTLAQNDHSKLARSMKAILSQHITGIDVFGISIMYPGQLPYGILLAKLIKRSNADAQIIFGGAQITMHIQSFIHDERFLDYVDMFVVKEGEFALVNILKKKPLHTIEHVFYRNNTSYTSSYDTVAPISVSEFAIPDFTGFSIDALTDSLPIRTLRGCFWGRCRFCTYPYVSGEFELTSEDFVIQTIKQLRAQYGIDSFEFIDSSIPSSFLNKIASKILEEKLQIQWCCRVNFEKAFLEPGFVSLLRTSGCHRLSFGFESANDRIVSLMNKMQKNTAIASHIVENVYRHSIQPSLYFMFGFPTETREEMLQTLHTALLFRKRFNADLSFSVFNLLEHTYIYDNISLFGIRKILTERKNSFHGLGHPFERSDGLDERIPYSFWMRGAMFSYFPHLYFFQKDKNRVKSRKNARLQ